MMACKLRWAGLASVLILSLVLAFLGGAFDAAPQLVLYCAHDSVYSEQLVRRFERKTGISVSIRFDTEATKALGLVNLIIRERNNPRCDVFWNNQVLGTLDLKEQGLLVPYKGPSYERIPACYKDADGLWTGFAGRMRVFIVNTDHIASPDHAISEAFEASDLSRTTWAIPLYGTTRSHFTLLWSQWGSRRLMEWTKQRRERGVVEARGNAMVKDLVSSGRCELGWTDTDDYFVAFDRGHPVQMRPVRLDNGRTICIPNSVAIIRGTRRLDEAKQFVDFLVSADTEVSLAQSKSRQIPLGPVDSAKLPQEVKQLQAWAADSVDIKSMDEARQPCLEWLKSEYLR